MHSVRLYVARGCLGFFVLALIAGAAWAQAEVQWSGRGEATGRGTEAELKQKATDNGRQRALATWLKARLETTLFNEYSTQLQRTILQRPQDYIISETVGEIERPSAQTIRLTVKARFDEQALESALRTGGFLRPWSGRKDIVTYALQRSDAGFALAATTGEQVDVLLRQLSQHEFAARGLTAAAVAQLAALGLQSAETAFARALTAHVGQAVQVVWLRGPAPLTALEGYAIVGPQAAASAGWQWRLLAETGTVPAVSQALAEAVDSLDRPWEHWLVLRSSLDGPELLARAARLTEVAILDEITPTYLRRQPPRSELTLRFFSLASTAEVETQLRQRMAPARVSWGLSSTGRPQATLELE